jgi:hypothetical protein
MKKEPKEFYDRRYDEIETLYINLIKNPKLITQKL